MTYRTGALLGLVVACAFSLPASADPSGVWHCQFANTPLAGNNNPYDSWMYQFDLQLNPDGSGYGQGSYYAQSAGYQEPVQIQGQWQQSSDGVGMMFQGQANKQSGPVPFSLVLRYADESNMMYRTETAMGIVTQACQR